MILLSIKYLDSFLEISSDSAIRLIFLSSVTFSFLLYQYMFVYISFDREFNADQEYIVILGV